MKPNRLLTLIALMLSTQLASAEIVGAEIGYTALGNNTVKIRLVRYFDCAGFSVTSSESVVINGDNTLLSTVTLTRDSIKEIPYVAASLINHTTCHNGGTYLGIKAGYYSYTFQLPGGYNSYFFGYSYYQRGGLDNLSSGTHAYYIESELNAQALSSMGQQNSSPIFSCYPALYSHDNILMNINQGLYDIDGDSLDIRIVEPKLDHSSFVPYASGYSTSLPFDCVSGSYKYDPRNGQMQLIARHLSIPLVQAFTVQVNEYRNGIFIGSSMRDFVTAFLNTPNSVTTINPPAAISSSVSFVPDSTGLGGSFYAPPGTQFSFSQTAATSNTTVPIAPYSNINMAIPGSSYTVSGTNPASITYQIQVPTLSSTASDKHYYFYTDFNDQLAPLPVHNIIGFHINNSNVLGTVSRTTERTIQVYPSPVRAGESLTLIAENMDSGETVINLTDINGQVLRSVQPLFNSGVNIVQLDTKGLSAGFYMLDIKQSGFHKTVKILLN